MAQARPRMQRSIGANLMRMAYASGPELPLVGRSDAAPQLRQTGHSCIMQHILGPNDRNAERLCENSIRRENLRMYLL